MFEKDRLTIRAMLDSIEKIIMYSNTHQDADTFYGNQRDFDATMMNFIIIGEMVNRFSEEFIKSNVNIEWQKIRGFRNLVAHNYFGIDAEEVWDIIKNHLPKLEQELSELLTK